MLSAFLFSFLMLLSYHRTGQMYILSLQDNITEDAESRQFYCDVIVDEANKMNRLVQKLLTLNQLESVVDKENC